jgi:signal transduction histidine kinase
MFHTTTLKLTGLYLTIIMAISLFFSANLYRISTQEIDHGFQRQVQALQQLPRLRSFTDDIDFLQQRADQLSEAKRHVFLQLFYTNLLILIIGGGLSYYLARRTLDPIEEAHEAQKRFTADASHELRTPLTVMQTEIEVALRNPKLTKDDAKQLLQSNLEELAKLTALSEGLLRLARLESHNLPRVPVPVHEMITEAIDRVLPLAEMKHLLVDYQSRNAHEVIGDKTSLVELLVILLDNAIKYSPEKTTVRISEQLSGRQLSIRVADQGPGLTTEEQEHIFERFYRADDSRTSTKTPGYGLGLSIAKSIADIHDGSLEVKSTVGKGTTFTITLPLA